MIVAPLRVTQFFCNCSKLFKCKFYSHFKHFPVCLDPDFEPAVHDQTLDPAPRAQEILIVPEIPPSPGLSEKAVPAQKRKNKHLRHLTNKNRPVWNRFKGLNMGFGKLVSLHKFNMCKLFMSIIFRCATLHKQDILIFPICLAFFFC